MVAGLIVFCGMKFADKCLREKARVLKKMFLAAKYAKYERVCKPLYFSGL